MDDEHKILVNKINTLAEDIESNKPKVIISSYQDLLSYTREHFSHEESYLQKIQYPDFAIHKKIHENLLKKWKSMEPRLKIIKLMLVT